MKTFPTRVRRRVYAARFMLLGHFAVQINASILFRLFNLFIGGLSGVRNYCHARSQNRSHITADLVGLNRSRVACIRVTQDQQLKYVSYYLFSVSQKFLLFFFAKRKPSDAEVRMASAPSDKDGFAEWHWEAKEAANMSTDGREVTK